MLSLAQKWLDDLRPTMHKFALPQNLKLDQEWEVLKLIMAATPSEVRIKMSLGFMDYESLTHSFIFSRVLRDSISHFSVRRSVGPLVRRSQNCFKGFLKRFHV